MPSRNEPVSPVRRLTRCALLTAIALTIFMAEAQLPAPIPVPGVKLGLSNIVTVYAMYVLGPGSTLMILLSRIFLGAVFSGQMMTILYSLGGGLVCYLAMLVLPTTRASSSGHWEMKPVTDPISKPATNGSKKKIPAVPANTNKHARKTIPTFSVRCITAMKEWKNTASARMPPDR